MQGHGARRTTDLLSFNTLSSSTSNERTVVLSPRALRVANGTNKQRCFSLPGLSHVLLRSMQVSEAHQPCSLHGHLYCGVTSAAANYAMKVRFVVALYYFDVCLLAP